jgi:diacylglycerol kinase
VGFCGDVVPCPPFCPERRIADSNHRPHSPAVRARDIGAIVVLSVIIAAFLLGPLAWALYERWWGG